MKRNEGDRVTITFETKAFCDVTVAIEEAAEKGTGTSASRRSQSPFTRIVRHLASGVLGPNAPDPFQKNAKKQTLVWDGKDDHGRYIDEKDKLTVRVSLGLKPRFEQTLFWSPKRRFAGRAPLIVAAEEGVYVYEGEGVDHLRLFDHKGNYLRTIYPFPAAQLAHVQGLDRVRFPQLATPLPLKRSAYRNTLLTSGENGEHCLKTRSKEGLTGNARIVSVGLGYDATERVALKTGGRDQGPGVTGVEDRGPEAPDTRSRRSAGC